jgi:hypothetical protein
VGRLNDRLAYILGYENLTPRNIHVVKRREFGDIYVGASHLFSATPADARANGAPSTVALAQRWAARLRKVLPQGIKGSNRNEPVRYPRLHPDAHLIR